MPRTMNIRMLPLALAPIVALALIVASPAAAQSGADWYVKGARLAEYSLTPVLLKGSSSIYMTSFGERVSCHTRGAGAIANAEEVGEDEITELDFSECKLELGLAEKARVRACPKHSKLELTAQRLPWYGILEDAPINAIREVSFSIECTGYGPIAEAEGNLEATVTRGKLSFGVEEGGGSYGNFLAPDEAFNGVWSIIGPPGERAITALVPFED